MRFFLKLILISAWLGIIPQSSQVNALCSTPYCPPPWLAFQGHCYQWVDKQMSWMDAERHCQMLSHPGKMVHLASIHSEEEDEFISDYVKEASGNPSNPPGYWMGYNDHQQENTFTWTDGSDSAYDNWQPREPNDSNGEDCVERHQFFNKWNDLDCSNKLTFVCKM
ncbi:alpha-N-acetylgalactosamine-specific lectin-like [Patiria miniata]|uniref:C-type lectin domain-containing protein n=1 Tax=Patiria miniata TaxID=46514 RepID=A0A914A4Q4_PATMI|nr:alpha-N-acetylgalactosamine-specific lectin-like [Patiria miniata]